MEIWLPKKLQATGGTSSFARKFAAGMAARGHQVHFSRPAQYDALLASPRAPLSALLHAKWSKKPILHRLDGVYYPRSSAGVFWRLHNLPLSIIRRYFASSIVYQSKFSQEQCEKYLWPLSRNKPSTIIYNGVDTKLFTPEGNSESLRDNSDQKIFITWSRFRRPDQIDPMVAGFRHFHEHVEKNSKLIVIGNFEGKVSDRPERYRNKNIEFRGIVPNQELPRYARGADVFVITHENPPCPNNVIEAMACGLPIAGIVDGAMPELVTNNGHLVSAADPHALAEAMHHCLTNHATLANRSRERAIQQFDLPTMLKKYEEAFQPTLD